MSGCPQPDMHSLTSDPCQLASDPCQPEDRLTYVNRQPDLRVANLNLSPWLAPLAVVADFLEGKIHLFECLFTEVRNA